MSHPLYIILAWMYWSHCVHLRNKYMDCSFVHTNSSSSVNAHTFATSNIIIIWCNLQRVQCDQCATIFHGNNTSVGDRVFLIDKCYRSSQFWRYAQSYTYSSIMIFRIMCVCLLQITTCHAGLLFDIWTTFDISVPRINTTYTQARIESTTSVDRRFADPWTMCQA